MTVFKIENSFDQSGLNDEIKCNWKQQQFYM